MDRQIFPLKRVFRYREVEISLRHLIGTIGATRAQNSGRGANNINVTHTRGVNNKKYDNKSYTNILIILL